MILVIFNNYLNIIIKMNIQEYFQKKRLISYALCLRGPSHTIEL
jgi:hypothetical protein